MNPYDKINDPMRWQAYEEGADSRDDEVATLKAQLDAAQLEVERLTSCLLKANTSSEKFERDWYLTLDQLAAVLAAGARMREAVEEANLYFAATGFVHYTAEGWERFKKSALTPTAEPEKST